MKFGGVVDSTCKTLAYQWKFPDGTTDTSAHPSKTFNDVGPHIVTLEAWCDGCSAPRKSATVTVDVKEPELNIVTPSLNAKIVLPTIKVKGEMVPNDPNAVIQWETTIEGNKYATQTASGVEGQMEMSQFPSLNSSFGNNTIKAKAVVNGEVIDEKEVAVAYYFPLTGKQNPNGIMPNWFYYWGNMVDSGRIDILKYVSSLGIPAITNSPSRTSFFGPYSAGTNTNTGHTGIQAFYEYVVHESCHIELWEGWWGVGGLPNPELDTDKDKYPDSWELLHKGDGFDVGPNDEYIPEGGTAGYAYEEGVCWKRETQIDSSIYNNKDWSENGKMWTNTN